MPGNSERGALTFFMQFWLPVLFFMAVIFRVSCVPGTDVPGLFPFQDVGYHFFIYLLLAFSFARALKNARGKIKSPVLIFSTLVFALAYALTDEFHQGFVPGRSAAGFDVAIDALGGVVGGMIYTWLL